MPSLLFLGCNTAQLPYLRAARARGLRVVATDRNPAAPGAQLADRFHAVGYDEVKALVDLARAERLGPDDAVFTAAAHFAWEGASGVAAALGLRFASRRAVDTCLDKTKLYALLAELGVPVPPTRVVAHGERPELEAERVYYLKSDYGKSPRYCHRVQDVWPVLPRRFDAFYRRAFVLQEAVEGAHYRLNLYGGEAAVFLRVGEADWLPVPVLGPGHASVVQALRRVTAALGLEHGVTKFDVLADASGWFVIDLGLDPPQRLRVLCEHAGEDFAAAYLGAWLGDAPTLPAWAALCRPVLIRSVAPGAWRVTPLEDGA